MGWWVSQWITPGWTIFKHPGINKTLNNILPNTTTLPSWPPLSCGVTVSVVPSVLHCARPWTRVIASGSFPGHPVSKQLKTGKPQIAAQNSGERGYHCQQWPATWGPCLAGLQSYFLWALPLEKTLFCILNTPEQLSQPNETPQRFPDYPPSPWLSRCTRTNTQFFQMQLAALLLSMLSKLRAIED